MKKQLKLILIIVTLSLFFGCSSSNDENNNQNSMPTILLSKVINKIPNNPGYNKPVVEMFYNGKKLTSLKRYAYTSLYNTSPFITTDIFNYDNSGKLMNVSSSYVYPSNYNGPTTGLYITNSIITYNENNITKIKSFKDSVLYLEQVFEYNNNRLASINTIYDNENHMTNYNFDANENAILNGRTYDSNKGIVNSLPFWQYFYTRDYFDTSSVNNQSLVLPNSIFSIFPSQNNPISAEVPFLQYSYSYQYNADGYPSNSTITYSGITQDYSYEYITAN